VHQQQGVDTDRTCEVDDDAEPIQKTTISLFPTTVLAPVQHDKPSSLLPRQVVDADRRADYFA
jgi:hypothetical protein